MKKLHWKPLPSVCISKQTRAFRPELSLSLTKNHRERYRLLHRQAQRCPMILLNEHPSSRPTCGRKQRKRNNILLKRAAGVILTVTSFTHLRVANFVHGLVAGRPRACFAICSSADGLRPTVRPCRRCSGRRGVRLSVEGPTREGRWLTCSEMRSQVIQGDNWCNTDAVFASQNKFSQSYTQYERPSEQVCDDSVYPF